MLYNLRRSVGSMALIAAFVGIAPSANAQLTCPGPAGNGDQVYGTSLGPNELADACGVSASGYFALANDDASLNSAFGTNALFSTTTGADNSGFGANTLFSNTTGYDNNAVGTYALYSNTTGYFNNAAGYYALYANNVGYNNNAQGSYALSSNTSGYGNSAMGANSLLNLTTGIRNVGVGNNTGTSLVSGDYNVDIGWGVTGAGDETGVVRIGNPTYATTTYVAGIKDSVVTGAAVYVNSSGQLGVLASSERYKTDIESIPFSENKLQQLRPVTFHLKTEPTGTLQYGLIAEEVDKVYPELVIRNAGGQIQGVRYDELAPILLRQVQELQLRLAAQESELTGVRAQNADQAAIQATQLNAAQLQIAAQDAKLASIETLVRDMQQQVAHLNTQAEGGSQVAMR